MLASVPDSSLYALVKECDRASFMSLCVGGLAGTISAIYTRWLEVYTWWLVPISVGWTI